MPDIDEKRAALDAAIDEQCRYASEVLGKTRRLHPDEMLRYIPEHLRERERDARRELSAALWRDAVRIVRRARRSRRIPDRHEAGALARDAHAKLDHLAKLRDLGTEFVPASEIVEARIAAEVAYQLYRNALDKNGAKNSFDCRKPKRRAVTDDYVVLRHQMIDGIRVPVVRKV
jgi:hypothetical protein